MTVLRKVGLALLAPGIALVIAMAISSLALLASGNSPGTTFSTMWDYGTQYRSLITTVNTSVPLFLSATAVAVSSVRVLAPK